MMRLVRIKRPSYISISVRDNGDVVVRAGRNVSSRQIEEYIASKRDWIDENVRRMKARYASEHTPPDSTYLHGVMTPIIYIHAKGVSEYVDGVINIYYDNDRLSAFNDWLLSYAKVYLKKLYTIYAHDIVPMRVKFVKTYYGICYSKKKYICLNAKLVHADDECIRMVIHHELTHLDVPNHSDRFYRELERLEPNHRELSRRLKQIAR